MRVVQTAASDWAPPHMSGYPHLPAPPPQYQQSYHEDPQWPGHPPQPRGPPPPPPHGEPPRGRPPSVPYGAPPRGPPPSLPYGAPPRAPLPSLPYGAPPGATGEPPELHPKALLGPFTDVAQIKKVRGRLRNLEDRRHVVCFVQKLPPETKGEEAKEGPKVTAEGAAEDAAARAEVSAGGDGGAAGEQVHVAGSLPFARHARMVLLCLWNPPRRVLRVLRMLRVTCVSIPALLWRTAPRFPRSAGACVSEGGAPRLPGTPCRTGRGSRYGDGSRGQDDGRRNPRSVEGPL